jgi:hypothetical protein
MRFICVPAGMTLEEGLRVVGGYGDLELSELAQRQPEQLACGSVLSLKR